MLKRIGQVAECVATKVSRRAFLGKLGQGSLVVAGVLGGFLAFPSTSRAGKFKRCCFYGLCPGSCIRIKANQSCPADDFCGNAIIVTCDDPRCG
jgi:hypothetical protein